MAVSDPRHHSTVRYLIGVLGPGLVTGAADDDPSGIATYSQTGAQFGYGQLWVELLAAGKAGSSAGPPPAGTSWARLGAAGCRGASRR
jgi:hypothetical protein